MKSVHGEYASRRDFYIEKAGKEMPFAAEETESNDESLSAEERESCERINRITIEASAIEPTALPAVRLHLFNFLWRNPKADDHELREEMNRMARLSRQEREFAEEDNPLPTIGIEIEVPQRILTRHTVKILDELSIPNYEEGDLWEVNADFSYSPWVQARILQELAAMGAIPLKGAQKGNLGRVPEDVQLSLHINFGLPSGITAEEAFRFRNQIALINDVITYAFVSPQRIEQRKTDNAVLLKADARENKKANKKTIKDPSLDDTYDGGYMIESAPKNFTGITRLELRANEFRDFPTYRLLVESQRLVAILFSHMKTQSDFQITPAEQRLVALWNELRMEIEGYLDFYNLRPGAADKDRMTVAFTIRETNLKRDARKIVDTYARKVGEILRGEGDVEYGEMEPWQDAPPQQEALQM